MTVCTITMDFIVTFCRLMTFYQQQGKGLRVLNLKIFSAIACVQTRQVK